jgi:AcrR family transcriptional regulator
MKKQKRMPAKERKEVILRAALKTIAENNFERATTAKIAKAAGITEPLLYSHFTTKRDLQIAVLDMIGQDILEAANLLEKVGSLTFPQLRAVSKQQQKKIKKNPDRIKVMIKAVAVEDKMIKDKAWGNIKSIQQVIEKMLDKSISQPDIDSEMAAWLFIAWISMVSMINVLGKSDELPQEKIDRFSELVDSLLRPDQKQVIAEKE